MITFAKWCALGLALLLPGSFVVLAFVWLYRRAFADPLGR